LGVTLSHNFSVIKHIDTVIASCARNLSGLKTLRAHGMPQASLQLVFRTTALAKLSYASMLGGALQTLATETDLRLLSNEQANQVIKPVYPLWLNYVNRLTTNYFVP